MIGHWKLDEGAGAGTAVDSGPAGYHGAYHGSPGLDAAAVVGSGMDSSGGYMTADLGTDLPTGAEERTISIFVKPSESNNRKFLGYGDTPPGSAFEFTTEEYNLEMGVRFRHWGGNYHYGGITIGEWNHVAIRVPSGATHVGDVEVFIDGAEAASVRSSGSNIELASAASDLHVGTAAVGAESGQPFNGVIDEVQFYDETLSDEQIEFLCDNPGEIVTQAPQAIHPSPSDGAWRVALDTQLSWDAAFVEGFTPTYNVYFGTEALDPPLASSRQAETFYDPESELEAGARYYWRVDIVEPVGRVMVEVHPGRLWSFMSWCDSLKVVEWKLEDSWESGGSFYTSDSSGQGNDGRLYDYPEPGGPNRVAGVDGNCLEFSAAGEYVCNEDAVSLPLNESDEWTMNLYVQLDERTRNWTRIATFGDSWQRELIVGGDRKFGFVYERKYLLQSGAKTGVGVWQMVTVTCDANGVKMFVDGAEAGWMQRPFSQADEIDKEVNLLSYADGERFAGKIDEFTVWDGVVSDEDIELLAERLPKRGDCDGNGEVRMADLAELGRYWHSDTRIVAGEVVLDDLEDYAGAGDPCVAALWQGYEACAGTNALSLVTDAGRSHGGSQAMRWDYDFDVGRVAGFDYWLKDGEVDLSEYDRLHLWVYKETGSAGRRLWCKLLNQEEDEGGVWDMGEAWYPGGVGGLGEGAWVEWVIELEEIHSWESSSSVIPHDRINNLIGLSIGGYSEDGGAGTIYFDDFHLVAAKDRCVREALVRADSNGDCRVDFKDVGALARDWLVEID